MGWRGPSSISSSSPSSSVATFGRPRKNVVGASSSSGLLPIGSRGAPGKRGTAGSFRAAGSSRGIGGRSLSFDGTAAGAGGTSRGLSGLFASARFFSRDAATISSASRGSSGLACAVLSTGSALSLRRTAASSTPRTGVFPVVKDAREPSPNEGGATTSVRSCQASSPDMSSSSLASESTNVSEASCCVRGTGGTSETVFRSSDFAFAGRLVASVSETDGSGVAAGISSPDATEAYSALDIVKWMGISMLPSAGGMLGGGAGASCAGGERVGRAAARTSSSRSVTSASRNSVAD